jgi:hypothetical protein
MKNPFLFPLSDNQVILAVAVAIVARGVHFVMGEPPQPWWVYGLFGCIFTKLFSKFFLTPVD